MKILLLGDTHWGVRNDNPNAYEYFAKFYTHLFNYVDQNEIKTIIQLGDLFDKRKQINFLTLHECQQNFLFPAKERGINLYVISGNHDCFYKSTNKVNSVRLLQQTNMIVIDEKPVTIEFDKTKIDFYPWITEAKTPEAIEFSSNTNSKYAVGHFEFANFRLHKNQTADHGLDHHIMNRYDRVFSGHYHTISRRDNVLYTGTPYELDWADFNDIKGFWMLDTETDNLEFVKTPYRLFEKIEYDEDGEMPDMESITNKYVKVIIKNKKNQYIFDAFFVKLMSMNPYDVQVIDDEVIRAIDAALGTTVKVQTTADMINHVVDILPTNLDKIKLKKNIAEIYQEACELAKL